MDSTGGIFTAAFTAPCALSRASTAGALIINARTRSLERWTATDERKRFRGRRPLQGPGGYCSHLKH